VIYAAFSIYLLGILFMAMGVYRLWSGMLKPRWVNWALLPGTVVSEMAYIFGCLISGGEIRRAKLMEGGQAPPSRRKAAAAANAEAEPTTEAAPRLRYLGPVIAAFVTLLACGAGILILHAVLGEPVIGGFAAAADQLYRSLPASTGDFWQHVDRQLWLLRRMGRTWCELDWLNWRVPVFVYLAGCLSIRLAPVRRSLRATLGAVAALAGIIALVGLLWHRFDGLMGEIWPLLTYVWSALLFLLAASLIIRGGVGLIRGLLEK